LLTLALAIGALYWTISPVLMSIKYYSVTEGLRITRAWFVVAVPLGFSLIALRTLQSILRDIADLRSGRPPYRGERLFD
jgi:TRAP-type C4-dicarboxylate transport system permease small subunit